MDISSISSHIRSHARLRRHPPYASLCHITSLLKYRCCETVVRLVVLTAGFLFSLPHCVVQCVKILIYRWTSALFGAVVAAMQGSRVKVPIEYL